MGKKKRNRKRKITIKDTLTALRKANRENSVLFNKPTKTKDKKKHIDKYKCRNTKNNNHEKD